MEYSRTGPGRARPGESGSALVLAILLSVLLTLLGISFLVMSDIENRIAQNEKYDAQALYAAEGGVRVVSLWFNDPGSALDFAGVSVLDRSQREADPDGPGPAPATAGTVYKGGVDRDGDGVDDVFDRPYRGDPLDEFLGTESHPDIRIEEGGAGDTFLKDALSPRLLGDFPTGQNLQARIHRIDIYAPPIVETASGVWSRYGIASVKVVARIYQRRHGAEHVVGEKEVKVVLNEGPYRGPFGPLHSGKGLEFQPRLTAHWGAVTALETTEVDIGTLPTSLPRSIAGAPRVDPLWGFASGFGPFKVEVGTEEAVEDPWFRLESGAMISGAPSTAVQPFPSPWESWDADESDEEEEEAWSGGGPAPPPPPCCDQSNLFQSQALAGYPNYPYEIWKRIATAGGRDVHYFMHDSADRFKENGRGTARSFAEITDGQEGVFFFETADALPPVDTDDDGFLDNLTPPITISGGTWSFRGMLYLNAERFTTDGVTGRPATFQAPGEPFEDLNQDGRHGPGEGWIDLFYPTLLDEDFDDEEGHYFEIVNDGGSAFRATRGPEITANASLWGILYTNGQFDSAGEVRHYGTVIAREGVVRGAAAGNPEIYWDESIVTEWPPSGWSVPRVVITAWSTGH